MANPVRLVVKDSNGVAFDPASLPHSYTYDTYGNMLTDTCVESSAIVRVKTYTYTGANNSLVASESAWMVQ
jgi:hypothetical protein